jgi:opacity protein-like surface antigen
MKSLVCALLLTLCVAGTASAQGIAADDTPTFSLRGFGLVSAQTFAAKKTFDAVFGSHGGVFIGGGVEVVHSSGLFVDLEASYLSKTGQRAFVSGGETFQLGVPLHVKIIPFDVLGGYRLHLGESRFRPYIAAGMTSIGYKETSDFSEPGEDVDARRTGFMFAGGVDVRLSRLFSLSVDAADSKVTGILGQGGLSQQLGENNIGGISGRVRVIFGR